MSLSQGSSESISRSRIGASPKNDIFRFRVLISYKSVDRIANGVKKIYKKEKPEDERGTTVRASDLRCKKKDTWRGSTFAPRIRVEK